MPDTDDMHLADELRALGRSAVVPPVDPDRMAVAVCTALPSEGERRRTPRRLALAALAALTALLASPTVRAEVADWLEFAGVRVDTGNPGRDASAPPDLHGGPRVEQAAAQVPFPVLVPGVLGRPTGVEVAADRRMVSMTWNDDRTVVRLDQFDGTLDFSIAKQSPGVRFAAVGGVDALWFEDPHEVVLVAPDGSRRTETARLAGQTLIWPRGSTTLRLEGDLGLDEAVRIAESAALVG